MYYAQKIFQVNKFNKKNEILSKWLFENYIWLYDGKLL